MRRLFALQKERTVKSKRTGGGGGDMSMMQAGMLGVAAAVLAVQLKGGKAEYSIYVCVAAGVVLFSLIVDRLAGFVRTASGLMEYAGVQGGYLRHVQDDRHYLHCGILRGHLQGCRVSDPCRAD